LPYRINYSNQAHTNQKIKENKYSLSTESFSRIQRSAMLAAILFILFLLIDPPVTILGWVLSLGIAALLVYIVIQILFLTKNQNSH